jgi:hypothetical protein
VKTGITLGERGGGEVGNSLLGMQTNGVPVEVTDDNAVVTAVTVRPVLALKFSTEYQLKLTAAIQDTDVDAQGQPDPKALDQAPYETKFKTFGPEAVGGTGGVNFSSANVSVMDNRAYLLETMYFTAGRIRAFNVEDPADPQEIPSAEAWLAGGRPFDLEGMKETTVSGGRLLSSTQVYLGTDVSALDRMLDKSHPAGEGGRGRTMGVDPWRQRRTRSIPTSPRPPRPVAGVPVSRGRASASWTWWRRTRRASDPKRSSGSTRRLGASTVSTPRWFTGTTTRKRSRRLSRKTTGPPSGSSASVRSF